MDKDMHVSVIGAGVSGLSLAAVLVRNGIKVTVFEKDDGVGGLAASFRRDGYVLDLGPHIFFAKKIIPRLNIFFDAEKVIVENKNLRQGIYIQGKIFSHPFRPKEILARIEKRKLPGAVVGAALSNFPIRNGQETLEEWVKSKIGKSLFDYIELDTYVRKLYGIGARDISSDWGKHRLKPIANLSFWRVVNAAANPWAKHKKRYPYYCPGGIGEVAAHLADYVVKNGGEIQVRSPVEEIVTNNGSIEEILVGKGGSRRSVKTDFVVSTIRISDLVFRIKPKAAQEILQAACSIRHRNLIILYMVVDRKQLFDHCLVYFSTKDTLFKRITEYKHFSPEMAPENQTSLSVEICTDPGDELWEYADDEIFDMVIDDIEKLGIFSRKEVKEYFSVRIPAVYPVYFLGYQDHLKALLDYLGGIANLVSIGRQGLYQHDNMATAIESGLNIGALVARRGVEDPGSVSRVIYEERRNKYHDIS
jgi:protoporphyrinogen oxidase